MPLTISEPALEETVEARTVLVPSRLMTFDSFLDFFGPTDYVELIDGVAQKRMAAQLEHESLEVFLLSLINVYSGMHGFGKVLGSRTAVQIGRYRGRLPDILFIRKDRTGNLDPKGVRFAPDFVIEIVSPNDRPSDLMALEVDYRAIGVPQIAFINQQEQSVRVLRAHPTPDDALAYDDETLTTADVLRLDALGGVEIPAHWLFETPLIEVHVALEKLSHS